MFFTALFLLPLKPASPATRELGNGFRDHGVATPISGHRGVVATADGKGHNVVLVWLNDHRGGYELLLIDVDTGTAEEFPLPFPPGDHPFASILSTRNRFYTHFNSHFIEFDPVERAFTFSRKTAPQMAMSMTEDDQGVIWSVTYPESGVVSFDPATRAFTDYGHVYQQDWEQYPRSVAADDEGWIYFGIGSTRSQIIVFDPRTKTATPVVREDQRGHGFGHVYRDTDGKVYGEPLSGRNNDWHMFHQGQVTRIGRRDSVDRKPYITGSQGLFHRTFPDGRRIKTLDLAERRLVVEDPQAKTTRTSSFDYMSEGALIMGVAAAPDGTICGGTTFPMRFFSYDPHSDGWINRDCFMQWNTVARQGDRFFVGGYGGGFLLEWNPAGSWVPTEAGNRQSNPRWLAGSEPTIHRPHDLLSHPDGRRLVLAGTPGYGLTGGGLLFWDRVTEKSEILTHDQILPGHSTMSLVALSEGKFLGGTTTAAGTGGRKLATEAELYIMDMATKEVPWHEAILPGVQEYTDLLLGPDGLVYGIADRRRFFVFDVAQQQLVQERDTGAQFGSTAWQQGPRVFVQGPESRIHLLFVQGIARIEPRTFQITNVATSPVPIDAGGDILDGRIYFVSGSHVCSYSLAD
jgi:hypothetical protein